MGQLVELEIKRVSRLNARVGVTSGLSLPTLEAMLQSGTAGIKRDPTPDRWGVIVSDDAQPRELATIIEAEEECGDDDNPVYHFVGLSGREEV